MKPISKRVAMVLEEGTPYALRLMEGALRYTEQHPGIHLLEADFKSGHTPKWLAEGSDCDGLFLWASPSEHWVERLLQRNIPAVNACGTPPRLMPTVAFTVKGIMSAALDHVTSLGRDTVAMVLYNLDDDPGFGMRRDVFMRQATERGLHPLSFDVGRQRTIERKPPRLTTIGQQRLERFLKRLPRPATIWAMDDFMGYVIIETARRLGLDVPDQLAVLGFGDYPVARYCRPQLTSFPQPGELIGFEAMRVLDGMMSGRPQEQLLIAIDSPQMVVRDSTRASDEEVDLMLKVHDFMTERACQGITVEDALRLVPLSLPTFHKRFQAAYGRTPGAEIRHLKVEQAKHYLRTTSLTITRIAQLCGYNHQAKFANFFKRETKQTPSAYRASTKQGSP